MTALPPKAALESAIVYAEGDLLLLELAADAVLERENDGADFFKVKAPVGFRLLLLTTDQTDALGHAIVRVRHSLEAVSAAFYGPDRL